MALENLRIIRLEAENVKRLVAVEITPEGDVIEVSGKNGQGKTSVLDAILWALAGGRAIQWKPIREGEEKAHIEVDLGNDDGLQLQVTRTFTKQEDGTFTTYLKVVNADGFKPQGAQTLLESIVGALSFDPGDFMRVKPDQQVAILKGLIPGVDFDKLATKRKALFEDRTDLNRDLRSVQAQIKAFPEAPADTPDEPVDQSALLEEADQISKANADREREALRRAQLRGTRDRVFDERDRLNGEAEQLRQRAAELNDQAMECNARGVAIETELSGLEALPDVRDVAEVRERLRNAAAINEWVQSKKARANLQASADALVKKVEALTASIEEVDREVVDAVASAKLPVSGLELREDMVFLRGVPFDQASDAEQLRASMALAIAANPRLRVIRIRNGSLLDDDALEIIREVAAAENFQIWIERVGAGGEGAIIMENGEVKNG